MITIRKAALLLAATTLISSASAQSNGYKVYDFKNCMWDITDAWGDTSHSFLFGYFNHVSANGKYAVGTDEEVMFRSFLWSDEDPSMIEMFGTYDSEIALFDVTNDGTLIGGKRDAEGVMYPAFKPQGGNWQMLTRGMEKLNYDMAVDDYVNMALRCASPDGKWMAGSFYMNTGEYSDAGIAVSHLVPVVWKDGKIDKVYDDLGIKEFMVWDISDDGSVVCGMNTAGIGGHNPSFIRDGKLIQLFDCGPERTVDTPDDVYGNTAGGICNSIDNQGNIYGYYDEVSGDAFVTTRYFVVPADCDYAVFLADDYNNQFPSEYCTNNWYVCGGNGKRYTKDNSHLVSLLDCSDDGSVFVGGGAYNLGYGTANIPQLCLYDQPLGPSSIRDVKSATQAQGISFNGHSLVVKGVYSQAALYDASGKLVAQIAQGQPVVLPQAEGVYMVTVQYADGQHSYKLKK